MDMSFLSSMQPGACNTPDNMMVNGATLFGGGTGFGCMKTLILPQFAAGNGWSSQLTALMPTQPAMSGLVTGTNPGFFFQVSLGSGATATLPGNGGPVLISQAQNGCLGLFESNSQQAGRAGGDVTGSGRASHLDIAGLGRMGGCAGGADSPVEGLGQGPMQVQVIAPSASALSQATVQLTYFYQDGNTSWQATVDPVDFTSAKRTWTAPLYQGGDYVTAFSVVNVSAVEQTVTVTLRDSTGGGNVTMQTSALAPGCGCNSWQKSAAGGFYASTVASMFPGLGAKTGSIEFTGDSGNIVVLVLRWIKNSMGTVPVR